MERTLAALCLTMTIGLAAGAAPANEEPNGAGAAQAVQQAILSKPGGTEKVLSLQDDPNVESLMQDEAVMRAVRSGNFGALARDERVEALMRNPTVRALAAELQR